MHGLAHEFGVEQEGKIPCLSKDQMPCDKRCMKKSTLDSHETLTDDKNHRVIRATILREEVLGREGSSKQAMTCLLEIFADRFLVHDLIFLLVFQSPEM